MLFGIFGVLSTDKFFFWVGLVYKQDIHYRSIFYTYVALREIALAVAVPAKKKGRKEKKIVKLFYLEIYLQVIVVDELESTVFFFSHHRYYWTRS